MKKSFFFRRWRGGLSSVLIFSLLSGVVYKYGGELKSQTGRLFDVIWSGGSSHSTTNSGGNDYELADVTVGDLSDLLYIKHTGFTLQYSLSKGVPLWVAWKLTKEHAWGEIERGDEFFADPKVPSSKRVEPWDYKGSGYDRGHMCPAADNKYSKQAMHDCFYMTNMCPQNHTLNAEAWERLEKACRRWAKRWGEIYICCGAIFQGHWHNTIGIEHTVMVPEGFFKAVLCLTPGHEKAIAFYYYNDDRKQTMQTNSCTVDEIEAVTGINLFYNVPLEIQNKVECRYNLSEWDRR